MRTQLGAVVTEPAVSVTINDQRVQSPRVWQHVPVYVVRPSSSTFQLCVNVPDAQIIIELDSFAGVGTCTIAPGKGVFTEFQGDVSVRLVTDSLSAGTISIDLYNEVAKHCTGRFAFDARKQDLPTDPPMVRRLRDGYFSVPAYLQDGR